MIVNVLSRLYLIIYADEGFTAIFPTLISHVLSNNQCCEFHYKTDLIVGGS